MDFKSVMGTVFLIFFIGWIWTSFFSDDDKSDLSTRETSSYTSLTEGTEKNTAILTFLAPNERTFDIGLDIISSNDGVALRGFLESGEVYVINSGKTVLVLDKQYLEGWAYVKVMSGAYNGEKGYMPYNHLEEMTTPNDSKVRAASGTEPVE